MNSETYGKTYRVPPIIFAFLVFVTGIVAGSIYTQFKLISSFFVLFILFFIIVKLFKRESIAILTLILFFFLGYFLISSALNPFIQKNHISHYTDKGKFWIRCRVVSLPVVLKNMEKLIVSVETIGIKKAFYDKRDHYHQREKAKSHKNYAKLRKRNAKSKKRNTKLHKTYFKTKHVTGKIKLTVHGNCLRYYDKIRYGDEIQFFGKIKSIHNFNNPGGFDYQRYMKLKSVFGSAWAEMDKIKILHPKKNHRFFLSFIRSLEDFRDNFSLFIFRKINNQRTAAVLSAIITGKKELIDKNLRKEFSRAGASHILAISGLHLSIVSLVFFYFFNFLLSFSKPLLIRAWSRKGAAVLTLFPLLFYAVLSGFSPSTRRAFIMIAVFMFSFVAEREADSLNSLALAGIIVLLIDPGAVFSISFQLSFTAVLFIILGFYLIGKLNFKQKTNLINRLFFFILTSIFAITGTQILVMRYFNITSFAGVLTNLLLIPAAGFGAVPLGLSALLIHPFSIPVSGFLVKCAGVILSFCLVFIHHIAGLSFSWARTVTPDHMEIFCYYLFFAGIFLLFDNKKKAGLFCMILAMAVFSGNEIICLKRRFFNKNIYVTILDVGQGSSALIELPQGKRVLVDGGGFSYFSNFDTGEYIVAPFLWQKKIMDIDMVVLSHPESDHMNGLVYIFKNFKVKKFIKNCDTREISAYKDLMKAVTVNKSEIEIISDKEKKINISGACLDFFNPFIKCTNAGEPHKDLNNNSVVFRLSFKKRSILFPGDIMIDAEKKIVLTENKNLRSNVLISPHHGSSTSSSDFFLDKIDPQSVVISCGRHNRFHFPHLSVIKRYKRRRIKIFRTDLTGAIEICSNGTELKVITAMGRKGK